MTSNTNDAFALAVASLSDELQARGGEVMPSGRTVADVLSEVESKKHLVGALPPCRDDNGDFIPRGEREGLFAKMAELKRLNGMVEELDKFAEKMRIEDLARRHHEIHPRLMMDCCICLESIPFTDIGMEQFQPCCGGNMCTKCLHQSSKGGQMRMTKCPLCRAELIMDPKDLVPLIEVQAKKGKSWAQAQMGIYFLQDSDCEHGDAVPYEVDYGKALEWLRLAAEQRQPDAIRMIGQIHYGLYGEDIEGAEFSHSKARSLLKEAADLGNLRSQRNYAMMCRLGEGGPVDVAEAAHYYTLAYSQKEHVHLHRDNAEEITTSAHCLGLYYYNGSGGLAKNLYRAKSYLEEGVMPEYRHEVDLYLASCLVELHHNVFGRDDVNIPGYSPSPRALALYKKSAEKMSEGHPVKEMLKQIEASAKAACANCGKAAGHLKTCVKCTCTWYCSKDCQRQHWKAGAGHKSDCVQYDLMVPGMALYNQRRKEEFVRSMQIAAIARRYGMEPKPWHFD